MMFSDLKQKYIELNLDDIFNKKGYINPFDKKIYQDNKFVEKIKLTRTKNNPLKIGDDFLSGYTSITNIDITYVSNVTQIGDFFLYGCTGITNLDLSPLSNVINIGNCFLSGCMGITNLVLSLSNITHIKSSFLSGCTSITNLNI